MAETKNTLLSGFARVDITPPLGTPLVGYYNVIDRLAETILDNLEVNALAVSDGKNTVVMLSADLLFMHRATTAEFRQKISEECGIPVDNVLICCTHTHNGPMVDRAAPDSSEPRLKGNLYIDHLGYQMVKAAKHAIADLKPSKLGYGVANVKNISFIRRYLMKNGSVRTNPDGYAADVVRPVSDIDDQVITLRFLREGGKDIALGNFGVHACCMAGGTRVSADFPRFVRETIEAVMDVHCVFFTGAQGDVNHIDFKRERLLTDPYVKEHDYVDEGYNYTVRINAKHIGRAIAGGMLEVYGDMDWVDVDTVGAVGAECVVPTQLPDPAELPWAEHVVALHNAGRDNEIEHDPTRIKVGHVVARACRMMNLRNGPETASIPVCAVRVGPIAFVGIGGEPFTGIGLALKEQSPFTLTLPLCCTNGYEGYYPMQECYDKYDYEAGSSPFAAGVAERIIETGVELMNKLK